MAADQTPHSAPGESTLLVNIARMEQLLADLREERRQANAATKDLNLALREARVFYEKKLRQDFGEHVAGIVKSGLKEYSETTAKAAHDAYSHVQKQIDVLVDLALGRPHETRDGKKVDLRPALAKKLRQAIDEMIKEHE